MIQIFLIFVILLGIRNCMATATSALTGEGVHEGIAWMKDCVEANSSKRPPKESKIS